MPGVDEFNGRHSEINNAREAFSRRLSDVGVDVQDYAAEENILRDNLVRNREVDVDFEKLALEKSKVLERSIVDKTQLYEKNSLDTLTGAKNLAYYRKTTEALQREADFARHPEKSKRHINMPIEFAEKPFALLTLDLDHFKEINDKYGHPAGDEVLKEFVRRILDRPLRTGDVLARCGGEEFRVVALSANGGATALAEILRSIIAEKPFIITDEFGNKQEIKVTVSIGVASYNESTAEMERLSDLALYAAKRGHRNKVYVMNEKTGEPVEFVAESIPKAA